MKASLVVMAEEGGWAEAAREVPRGCASAARELGSLFAEFLDIPDLDRPRSID